MRHKRFETEFSEGENSVVEGDIKAHCNVK